MTNGSKALTRIAVFASGAGSNTEKIIQHTLLSDTPFFEVALVVTNNPAAGVLSIAANHGIETLVIDKGQFFRRNAYVDELKEKGIDFVVLAGFLWKVPPQLLSSYRNNIINIHPALLPNYGGKGMYGQHVHEAVIANGDTESGISIHWVDEQYDHGTVIFQAKCPVLPGDKPEELAARIHSLEHLYYPEVITTIMEGFAKKTLEK